MIIYTTYACETVCVTIHCSYTFRYFEFLNKIQWTLFPLDILNTFVFKAVDTHRCSIYDKLEIFQDKMH
jgi:hypothetical protein